MRGGFFDPSKFPEGFLAEQLRSGRRSGYAQVECGYFRALPSYVAARNLYSRINVPVTLIYGDRHHSSKPARARRGRTAGARKSEDHPNQLGHFGSLEHPDEIANIVIEGLRSPVAG